MTYSNLHIFDSNYNKFSDEELIEQIRLGNLEAQNFLLEKYRNLVSIKANRFFLIGAESDDMIQEGMIGLFKAIQSFNKDKNNSFKTFANLCIERQLITALKTSNRQKHIPLNSSFSLNVSAFEDNDDTTVLEVLDAKVVEDPLDTITKREYMEFIESRIDKNLSTFEKQVLEKYLEGKPTRVIAKELNKTPKSITNTIQRIKIKVKNA